jgi:hypothetical protein
MEALAAKERRNALAAPAVDSPLIFVVLLSMRGSQPASERAQAGHGAAASTRPQMLRKSYSEHNRISLWKSHLI